MPEILRHRTTIASKVRRQSRLRWRTKWATISVWNTITTPASALSSAVLWPRLQGMLITGPGFSLLQWLLFCSGAGNVYWSSCSLEYLSWSISHGADYCLRNGPPTAKEAICGNGFVEDGEECDCGLPDVSSCQSSLFRPPPRTFSSGVRQSLLQCEHLPLREWRPLRQWRLLRSPDLPGKADWIDGFVLMYIFFLFSSCHWPPFAEKSRTNATWRNSAMGSRRSVQRIRTNRMA